MQRLHDSLLQGSSGEDIQKGIELVVKQVSGELSKVGLELIKTSGSRFDPRTMEAIMTTEVEEEHEGMVLEEIRSGFVLGEHVVRPAGVRVGVTRKA